MAAGERETVTQIILSDDQLATIRAATDAVAIRDRQGKLLGYVSPPPTDEEIVLARRRAESAGPWHSTDQVLDRLKSLDRG